MEKKSKPVAPWRAWVKNRITKLITFFTCIVLIFVSINICSTCYGIEYEYYENKTIQVGVTQQQDLLSHVIKDYINELEENGYYICSYTINIDVICNKKIIENKYTNNINDEIKQFILDNINISIFSTKLSIRNDDNTYYFKTEDECNKFVSDLKKYNDKIETTIESDIVDINKITDSKILEEKVEKYRLDRKARDAEAAAKRKASEQKKQVTSRSSINRASYSKGSRHPLDSYTCISSGYGQRWGQLHTGVDFATPTGTSVHAWKAGKVVYASWCGSYGNYVRIQHNDGTESCYAHLSSFACSVGSYVDCHDIIAYSGSTGNSTGPHVHFEIKVNNQFVDPLNYL